MINLNGKVALITGSSDGIGAATAVLFSSLGAKVAIVGRTQSKLDKVAAECEAKSPEKLKPVVICADFEKDEDVKRTLNETIKSYDRLDILVNNAGIASHRTIDCPDALEDFDRVMQVNLRAVVMLTKMAKCHLAKSKGAIVNVSTMATTRVFTAYWSYSMAKAGLDMFTRTMASLFAPDIRVNSVNPGPVRTNILGPTNNQDEVWDAMATVTAMKRIGTPIDIANVIAFLASDLSKNMTGSLVVSDSGMLVNDPHIQSGAEP